MWSRVNILYFTKSQGQKIDFSHGFIATLAFFFLIAVAATVLIGLVDGLIGLNEDATPVFREQNPGKFSFWEGQALCYQHDVGWPTSGIWIDSYQFLPLNL